MFVYRGVLETAIWQASLAWESGSTPLPATIRYIEQDNYLFNAERYCNISQKYLNIVFNGSTRALGAWRVGSNPAIQTRGSLEVCQVP